MGNLIRLEVYKSGRTFSRVQNKRKNNLRGKTSPPRKEGDKSYINYSRGLRKIERFLSPVLLEKNKCLFVTLTTSNIFSVKQLNRCFEKFIAALRRLESCISYIKAIDAHKRDVRYHLHIIFQFPNGIPKVNGRQIHKEWFVKHWKHCSPRNINVKKTRTPYGALDYILNPKEENVIDYEKSTEDTVVVKFGAYTRIITWGKNLVFEQPIEVIECGIEESFDILNSQYDKLKEINGVEPFKRCVYSNWIDTETGEVKRNLMYCHIHP